MKKIPKEKSNNQEVDNITEFIYTDNIVETDINGGTEEPALLGDDNMNRNFRIKKNPFLKPVIIFVIITILIICTLSLFKFFSKDSSMTDNGLMKEGVEVLAQLKQIIILPSGIDPIIATIKDEQILKSEQPYFFADAKNGDWLIIYPDFAIIYDYAANKIVRVGSIQPITQTNKNITNVKTKK